MQRGGKNTPWQFKWQRPKLVASTKDPLLEGMVAIESKTARLTSTETKKVLDMLNKSDKDGNNLDIQRDGSGEENQADMKWEDLESCSDEDVRENEASQEEEDYDESEDDYILSVSALASTSSVQFMEYLRQNGVKDVDKNIVADALYLKVIKDSIKDRDESVNEVETDKHSAIFTRLLRWPSSTLTDIPGTNLVHFQDQFSIKWQSMIRGLTQQNDDEELQQQQQKLQLEKRRFNARIGVAAFSLCRQQLEDKISLGTLDHDDIAEIINQMSLGAYNNTNGNVQGVEFDSQFEIVSNKESTQDAEGIEDRENDLSELLLCCVTNDGQVMLYSALDLVVADSKKEYRDNHTKNLFEQIQDGNSTKVLDFGFETLLFGSEIQARLKKDILPLSSPKASISLSVVTTMNQNEIDTLNIFDLSLLDSNIDPSTIQYRTKNNIPSICVSSHNYIVVGGMGHKVVATSEVDELQHNEGEERHEVLGGFITFISTTHFSETKTIFLPFVPTSLSPFTWNKMKLVAVMGDSKSDCWAIRTDSTTLVPFVDERSTQSSIPSSLGQSIPVSKFSIMEFVLQDKVRRPLSIATLSKSAGVVSYFNDESSINITLQRMTILRRNSFSALQRSSNLHMPFQQRLAVECSFESHHSVQIPHSDVVKMQGTENSNKSQSIDIISCLSGEGWSLVGIKHCANVYLYFIAWYGATDCSFRYPLGGVHISELNNSALPLILSAAISSSTRRTYSIKEAMTIGGIDTNEYCIGNLIRNLLKLPKNTQEKQLAFQISNMLQSGSPSWKILSEAPLATEFQKVAATISFCDKSYLLTLRQNVVGGRLSTFYEIFTWLHHKKDYFTAVHIALNLLGDTESIRDLTGLCQGNSTKLLDGIEPIEASESSQWHNTENLCERTIESELTSLSNITVVSFNQGGAKMSHAFDGFLKRNHFYNPFEACLLLSASVAKVVGDIVNSDDGASNLAQYSFNPMVSETHTLWPIQCLLRVGIRRGILPTAILLLNATIPNEMRNNSFASSSTSLELCKSIVSMILASSTKSAGLLMNLVYPSDRTYWRSISESTRLELSLTKVCGGFPLLLETDVRDWMLGVLHSGTRQVEDDDNSVSSPWLQKLCLACLMNAGCNLVQPFETIKDNEDGNEKIEIFHEIFVVETNAFKILTSAQKDIDFNLLIPSLLLLAHRKEQWYDDIAISTQSLLNCTCTIATMASDNRMEFALETKPIIQQCATMENLDAASHLIGGNEGIIILCANIIIKGDSSKIGQAEEYLIGKRSLQALKKSISYTAQTDSNKKEFFPTDAHKQILWCLQKHVLMVKRYGYFVPVSTNITNKINPKFAAKVCLRAWIYISEMTQPSSSIWLENWLLLQIQNECNVLACSVLAQCLLWPDMETKDSSNDALLGECLGFSSKFLVRISRDSSSQGLQLVK